MFDISEEYQSIIGRKILGIEYCNPGIKYCRPNTALIHFDNKFSMKIAAQYENKKMITFEHSLVEDTEEKHTSNIQL